MAIENGVKCSKKITREVIIRSFEASGVAPFGKKVPVENFNGRLRGVLRYHEGIEEIQEEDNTDPFASSNEEDEVGSDMELDILDDM